MKKIVFTLILSSLLVLFNGCDKVDKLGPFICPPDDFTFVADQINIEGLNGDGKVDLAVNGITITADLGEKFKWVLRVVSDDSFKEYQGWSKIVDVSWFGNSDRAPVFKTGNVRIELEIACTSPVTKELEIISNPSFKSIPKNYGVLLRDWDSNGLYPVQSNNYSSDDGWANAASATFLYEYFDTEPSPSGGSYGEFMGNIETPGWYFGGHSIDVSDLDTTLSTDNTDSLYFNFYARGYGLENSNLEVGFKDGDANSFFYTEPITWEGWKFISVPLSDFKIGFQTGPLNPGATLNTLTGLTAIIMQLGAAPERTSEAKSGYDFLLITVGEPFYK
jgi:hypothetical protein